MVVEGGRGGGHDIGVGGGEGGWCERRASLFGVVRLTTFVAHERDLCTVEHGGPVGAFEREHLACAHDEWCGFAEARRCGVVC